MKLAFAFILFFSWSALASECSLELFSKVYRLTEAQGLLGSDIVKKTNCNIEVTSKLASLVSSSEGTVAISFLKKELEKDFPEKTFLFSTRKLSFFDLSNYLRDQVTQNTNLFFTQTKSLNGLRTLSLDEGEQINAVCDSCQSFGEKIIKININNALANSSRSLWFSSKVVAKIKVVKAKRNIGPQEKSLDSRDFYLDDVMTMTPDQSLTTLSNLRFYKLNKTVLQGAVISNFDLQPVNLVNYGTPVNVVLTSNTLSLQKTAMPVRSARLGEMVELQGPSHKNIVGKVVDYNKVVIEI